MTFGIHDSSCENALGRYKGVAWTHENWHFLGFGRQREIMQKLLIFGIKTFCMLTRHTHFQEDTVEGLEKAPAALLKLFDGSGRGFSGCRFAPGFPAQEAVSAFRCAMIVSCLLQVKSDLKSSKGGGETLIRVAASREHTRNRHALWIDTITFLLGLTL